ncbi:MAG: hypothetical protein AAB074_04500 [Planctomycetota bacterium]
MRPGCRALLLLVAALAGCGKDPFAGRKKKDGDKRDPIESKELATNAEKFDRGQVEAYERLVTARSKRDPAAWKAAFAGAPGEDAGVLFEESTDKHVTKILHQFQKSEPSGERAVLTVKEILEQRDAKGAVLTTEVTVTATLVKAGGEWKVEALKAGDWK